MNCDASSLYCGCYSDVNSQLELLAKQSQSREHDLSQLGREEIIQRLSRLSQPLSRNHDSTSVLTLATVLLLLHFGVLNTAEVESIIF